MQHGFIQTDLCETQNQSTMLRGDLLYNISTNWSTNMEIPTKNLFQPEINLYLSLSRSSCKSCMLNYLNKNHTQQFMTVR